MSCVNRATSCLGPFSVALTNARDSLLYKESLLVSKLFSEVDLSVWPPSESSAHKGEHWQRDHQRFGATARSFLTTYSHGNYVSVSDVVSYKGHDPSDQTLPSDGLKSHQLSDNHAGTKLPPYEPGCTQAIVQPLRLSVMVLVSLPVTVIQHQKTVI